MFLLDPYRKYALIFVNLILYQGPSFQVGTCRVLNCFQWLHGVQFGDVTEVLVFDMCQGMCMVSRPSPQSYLVSIFVLFMEMQ